MTTGRLPWLLASTVIVVWGTMSAPATAQNGGRVQNLQPAYEVRPPAAWRQGIQQAQRVTADDSKPKRPLPYEISSIPDEHEEMEIIHRRSKLIVTRAPISRIAIADPNIIDVVQYSPTEVGIIGLNLGTTNLTFWFDNSRQPLIYLAEVVRDPTYEERLRMDFGKLEKQLGILFPNSKVFLIPLQQRLVVKGQAATDEDANHILQIVRSAFFTEFGAYGQYAGYRGGAGGGYGGNNNNNNNNGDDDDDDFIVNMLEVPKNPQIMLHVKIAEVSRSQLRQLGVDLEAILNNGRHVVGSALGGTPSTLTGIFENNEVSVLINWLAGNRTAKILAAPTLTVLSGHQASFLSGGEFPVPTIVGVGGAQGQTTAFRGFGTSLLVRPDIIDRDWIKLRITPEYSQISQANAAGGTPGLNSKRASTTVKLREGQTIVLAGLYGSTMTTEVNRIPFLGELPIIGPALFNAKRADQGENELLIIVTPELVRPMEPDEVPPLPGFYVTPPNDIELYSYAKTEGYPEQGVFQLSPYGWGPGYATEIGYRNFNPAPGNYPFSNGGGGGAPAFTGYPPQGGGGGMMLPQSPPQIYPGTAPGQMQPPAGGAIPMQPVPDNNVSMRPGNSNMIQTVGYEEPQGRRGLLNFFRGGRDAISPQNPAVLPTNSTMPSLQNGNDPRLGRGGSNRPRRNPQQPRTPFRGNGY